MKQFSELSKLADAYSVRLEYTGFTGEQQRAEPEAVLAVLRSMGAPVENLTDVGSALLEREARVSGTIMDPVFVAWDGELIPVQLRLPARTDTSVHYELYLESGEVRSGDLLVRPGRRGASVAELRGRLPLGYHELAVEVGPYREHALIIAAPRRAHHDAHKSWGVFLPLYALRSRDMRAIASFNDLAALSEWASDAGADLVGTLPLLAGFLDEPFEPSPYSPVSRLFWNELFIDLASAARGGDCPEATSALHEPAFQKRAEQLSRAELVDYRAAAALKRSVLEPLARCFFAAHGEATAEVRTFIDENPRVEDYAAFRAVSERQRKDWRLWPARLRDGTIRPDDYDRAAFEYHVFAQYEAARQLDALKTRSKARLYLDVPLGVNGSGYDVWRERAMFATGVAAGAPPDAFFTEGQNWGFPPMIPDALRSDGYAYLRAALHTHLRYAGALRLDHVMSLYRLYWVPNGFPATQGVYVHYPTDELHAVLTLESARHSATIIGEDLGVVPPEVRERMKQHNLLRMYVVQFEAHSSERKPLDDPPPLSLVSLNTHDMPPFAAYHAGLDADLRQELGLLTAEETAQAHERRAQLMRQVERQLERAGYLQLPAHADDVHDALLAFLAASKAEVLLVNLEDLWAEIKPQNVPGTSFERPNWQRRSKLSLEEIVNEPALNALLSRIDHLRREH